MPPFDVIGLQRGAVPPFDVIGLQRRRCPPVMSSRLVSAGRVGRAHGLDGSFKVNQPCREFAPGSVVTVAGTERRVERAAGTARHPLIRLEGIADREAATALGGEELQVAETEAPLVEGEFRVADLVGCEVEGLGCVQRVLPGSSCDVLELDDGVLVPLIADAVDEVDVVGRRIGVNHAFLGLEGPS